MTVKIIYAQLRGRGEGGYIILYATSILDIIVQLAGSE